MLGSLPASSATRATHISLENGNVAGVQRYEKKERNKEMSEKEREHKKERGKRP